MDFGALPPEVNSAWMYSGPGPATMLAAAVAWDNLATELRSAATCYQSVVSALTTGPWQGPSSVSMAAAAAPQIGWLNEAGGQAEQTAGQARAAASVFETALAMTVPPPVIAANRALLTVLVATNFLGQNTPAIAATEAHYAEMWAQDAAAMYGYAGASAVAARLSPFTAPPPSVNPAGLTAQAAAVSQAGGADVAEALPQVLSSVPNALEALASPLALAENPLLELDYLLGAMTLTSTSASMASSLTTIVGALATPAEALGAAAVPLGSVLGSGLGGGALSSATSAGATVSANLGRAASLGGLSVPQNWAANAAPAAGSAALPGGGLGSATALESGAPGLLGGLPLGMPGHGGRSGPRIARARSVIPRTVCAG